MFEDQIKMVSQVRETYADKFMHQQPTTPIELIKDITDQIPFDGNASVLVMFTIEWALYLKHVGYKDVTVAAQGTDAIAKFCQYFGFKYINLDEKNNKMKFDVIVGNPPFQMKKGNAKIAIGTTIIKKAYTEMLADRGILAMVSASSFLGGGQKGLGYLFTENQTDRVWLRLNLYFPKIGIDIGGFVIRKIQSTSPVVRVVTIDGDVDITASDFVYNKTRPYIPRSITPATLPILRKIISYNTEVFDFRSSDSKGAHHKIGFWASANTGIHPQYLKITHTGEFDSKWISHPCKLDAEYPDENIRAVFAGKWFHFVITAISGSQANANPANLSFFPKIDLSKKWSFDELGDLFNMTAEEKNVVLNWASTRPAKHWADN